MSANSLIRLARDAVSVSVHMFAIAGVAAIERILASRADFVAAAIMDGLFNRIARSDFFLGHGREIIDAEEGQDDKGSGSFQE